MNGSDTTIGFLYILGTVMFSVYGQIVLKWQVNRAGKLPASFSAKIFFLGSLVLNPWIISGMAAGFCALVCWLAAMTKFDLGYAYPFLSLTFVLILILSGLLFNEAISAAKLVGVVLIIAGIIVGSRG